MSTTLTKDYLRVFVPDQPGQPAIGPMESCVPISPPPPPGGGSAPPPGGGGPGSGPPEGDLPVCIWEWMVSTNADGTPTSPPSGAFVPINAPCTGAPG